MPFSVLELTYPTTRLTSTLFDGWDMEKNLNYGMSIKDNNKRIAIPYAREKFPIENSKFNFEAISATTPA